jgi:hypothetical protein
MEGGKKPTGRTSRETAMSKKLKNLARAGVYTGLIVGIFWVAHIYSIPFENAKKMQEYQVLKREIELFWGITKIEIDMLNEDVQSYIERNGLKPGQPLSPKTFFTEKDSLRKQLTSDKPIDIMKSFTAKSGEYSTKATTFLTIMNRVPKEGERYVYGAIEHNYELFGQNFTIYPKDDYSYTRLKNGLRREMKENKGATEGEWSPLN